MVIQKQSSHSSVDGTIIIQGKKASATQMIAKMAPGRVRTAAVSYALDQAGLRVKRHFSTVPGLVLLEQKPQTQKSASINGLSTTEHMLALVDKAKKTGHFTYVEPDWTVHVLNEPNDSAYTDGTLWGLRNTGQSGGVAGVDINPVPAWSVSTGSSNVVVGVIDTGIRYTHQDLADNMWVNNGETPGNGVDDDGNGYIDDVHGINAINNSGDPADDNGHGTHAAGSIAAVGANSGGHVGVAYNTRLMALKFLGEDGSGNVSDAIRCIEYAVANGADILNNSWGGGGFSQAMADTIEAASQAGVLFVVAAGNSSSDNDASPTYPSSFTNANVVSVAAIDRSGRLATFSNYGAQSVDIGAPGVDIYSSVSNSDSAYALYSGTSMAAPHVSGVAALVLSAHPNASVSELKERLLSTSVSLSALADKTLTGGMVNAGAAVTLSADGALEVSVSQSAIQSGQNAQITVTVTDLYPVLNATVTGAFNSETPQPLLDDGVFPDTVANDGRYAIQLQVPDNASSVDFTVNISAVGKQSFNQTLTFPAVMRPVNDDFSNRITIAEEATEVTGNSDLSTQESGEPLNPTAAGGKTIWWEWNAPMGLTTATITTQGSSYDTTLAIYQGTVLQELTLIGANDDANGSVRSAVTFSPTAGGTYQIQVDGYGGATGDVTLNVPAGVDNSELPVITRQPTALSVLAGNAFELSVVAESETPLSYQWIRTDQDDLAIDGATESTYALESASIEDQGRYAVVVSNDAGAMRSNAVFVSVERLGLQPANDNLADARLLSGSTGRVTGANVRATGEENEPIHGSIAQPTNSVWYLWQAPAVGTLTLDTFGSDYDTVLAAYTGSSINNLQAITANDDASTGTLQSQITMSVELAQTYLIAVDGFLNATGQIVLNYQFSGNEVPDNDSFVQRRTLSGESATDTGRNINATGEAAEQNHAGVSVPVASVWWDWQAPTTGQVTVSTVGSDFDTVLAAYAGDSLANLALEGANDDFSGLTSQVTFNAQLGRRYAFAVDGFASREGNVTLQLTVVNSDTDEDGIADSEDNCPSVPNADQADADNDQAGDACDAFPTNPNEQVDSDGDNVGDNADVFPADPTESVDSDRDGIGNNADLDDDNDGLSDIEENIRDTDPFNPDTDGDTVKDGLEVELGLDPLDLNDCPEEFCPSTSVLMKLVPNLINR